jgi:RimJ/RimL family protein N-acetyltransferase
VGWRGPERRRVGGELPPPARQVPAPRGLRLPDPRASRRRRGGLGGTGLHRIDWSLRRFEIGYWRKTGCGGRGVVTEATRAMARLAFDALGARRVELRMDDNNERSWKVAERAGFTLEALLRFDAVTPRGEPRSTRVYARVRGAEEPFGA